METKKEENERMENFDRKIIQVFAEKLPEMPELSRIEELDMEALDQLQAAGNSMPSADIVRFLKKQQGTGGTL